MNYEGLFWLGIIMVSPLIYMISRMLFAFILSFVLGADEKIVITLESEDGKRETRKIDLKSGDELLALMDELKANQKRVKDH